MITITDSAKSKMLDLLAEENNPELKVRAFVQGGGCSGFQYGFSFDDEKAEDDLEFDNLVLVDAMSIQYLSGATVDYKDEVHGSQFVIQNPNATTTCGCGSSFSA